MVKKKDTLIEETEKIKVDLEKLREHKKENRTCKEICKKFIVKKPASGSRYGTVMYGITQDTNSEGKKIPILCGV